MHFNTSTTEIPHSCSLKHVCCNCNTFSLFHTLSLVRIFKVHKLSQFENAVMYLLTWYSGLFLLLARYDPDVANYNCTFQT